MGPKIDLSPHEADIRAWVDDGLTAEEQRRLLLRLHGITIGISTLGRWTQGKGIQQRRSNIEETPALRQAMVEAFQARMTDEQTLQVLRDKGFDLGMPTLKRVRTKMGFVKKTPRSKREAADADILKALEREMKEGYITDCGRSQVYAHMRAKYNFIGRDRMYKILREKFPDAVEQRRAGIRARNGRRKPQPPASRPEDTPSQAAVEQFRTSAVAALNGHELADERLLQAWQDHVDMFIDPNLRFS
ncbi:hypothetical protein B0A55_11948 [Friedmanniomyces simplex]|uniref:Clr5 domain-containing protein n=1 Tax=Friedmanniomyces simplex TaxID=329884 RepID=A0A4U0VMZ9_9PEZI|nr:hypothetical protein B0A55_11948 [Friedmanniomyces simplex]